MTRLRKTRQLVIVGALGLLASYVWAQNAPRPDDAEPAKPPKANERARPAPAKSPDAVEEAAKQHKVERTRPEQQLTEHDESPDFSAKKAKPSSPVFQDQPKAGKISGFDFVRDPLNADKPFTTFQEIFEKESAAKADVMQAQKKLLASRYVLEPKLDPEVKMSRGKPLAVGPTARLPKGVTWDSLGDMQPQEIKQQGSFPYPSLPHPLQTNGGQVFPAAQLEQFPRLARFDVDFDLPEAFIPE